MKKLLSLLCFPFLLLGCGSRIQQCPSSDYGAYPPIKYVTAVWYHNEIVWSCYDPIEELTDSLKTVRYNQALVIKNALKHKPK
jgi:uncharacterized protein YceK